MPLLAHKLQLVAEGPHTQSRQAGLVHKLQPLAWASQTRHLVVVVVVVVVGS
jgi:hypothetical protein